MGEFPWNVLFTCLPSPVPPVVCSGHHSYSNAILCRILKSCSLPNFFKNMQLLLNQVLDGGRAKHGVMYRPTAMQRLGKNIPAGANTRNNRIYIARQRVSEHASLTIQAAFSAWSVQNGYKKAFESTESRKPVWRRGRIPPPWPCESYEATKREVSNLRQ
jgi:hypothetical protein